MWKADTGEVKEQQKTWAGRGHRPVLRKLGEKRVEPCQSAIGFKVFEGRGLFSPKGVVLLLGSQSDGLSRGSEPIIGAGAVFGNSSPFPME